MQVSAAFTCTSIFHAENLPPSASTCAARSKTAVPCSVTPAATAVFRGESGAMCSYSQNILANSDFGMKGCTRGRLHAFHRSGPQPDTEEEGSALDFPEEYVRAVPSRRPDIFPDLKEPKQPLPKPMPGDPEVPDEEEEEEERKRSPGEPGTDPDEDEDENPKREKKEEGEEE